MALLLFVTEQPPPCELVRASAAELTAAHTTQRPLLATPELDRAMARFVSDATNARMAEDPVLGRMRRLPLPEGVTGVSVEVDQSALDSPSVPLTHGDTVMTDDMVLGNFEELHRVVLAMAESFLDQYLPSFFDHLGTAVESVGNSMDLKDEEFNADRILDAYERVEWVADDSGIVRPPQIYAGPDVTAKINALPELTHAQRSRFVDMWNTKQENHVSRRRSRQLREEPDGA